MTGYGQFCAIARALEILGPRWTLLIVRELLCGSRRFNDIRRGIPRISRTMLSERLQALTRSGAVARAGGAQGPEYALTAAGQELMATIGALDVKVADDGYLASIGPRLYDAFMARNVLLRPLGNTIYVMPPYCVGDTEIDRIYAVIDDVAT